MIEDSEILVNDVFKKMGLMRQTKKNPFQNLEKAPNKICRGTVINSRARRVELNGSDFNLALDFSAIFFKTMYVNAKTKLFNVWVSQKKNDQTTLLAPKTGITSAEQATSKTLRKWLECKVIV